MQARQRGEFFGSFDRLPKNVRAALYRVDYPLPLDIVEEMIDRLGSRRVERKILNFGKLKGTLKCPELYL